MRRQKPKILSLTYVLTVVASLRNTKLIFLCAKFKTPFLSMIHYASDLGYCKSSW